MQRKFKFSRPLLINIDIKEKYELLELTIVKYMQPDPEILSFYFNRIKHLKICTRIKLKNQNDITTKLDILSSDFMCVIKWVSVCQHSATYNYII